ncbi:MAG: hypothetical protein O9308_13390 [Beijerinckiaceae bacterium]|nr:hypothetical protein [Beijerinckiaceae bacterium]
MNGFSITLLMKQAFKIDQEHLHAAIAQFSGGNCELELEESASSEPTVFLKVDGHTIFILNMDTPHPGLSEYVPDGPNLFWSTVSEDLAEHSAHIILACVSRTSDYNSAISTARAVSILAGAIARMHDCIGIYVPSAENFINSEFYLKQIEQYIRKDAVPINAWVRHYIFEDQDGPVVVTNGLRPFLGTEFEIFGSISSQGGFLGNLFGKKKSQIVANLSELLPTAMTISSYALQGNVALQRGETIGGEDGGIKFMISYANEGKLDTGPVTHFRPMSVS